MNKNRIINVFAVLITLTIVFCAQDTVDNSANNAISEPTAEAPVKIVTNVPVDNSRYSAITRAIKKVSPAVASINVVQMREYSTNSFYNDPFFRHFFPNELYRQRVKGSGSGVVISKDGFVLTNHHVVEDAVEIIVTLPGGKEHVAEVIGFDEMTDVALLKLIGDNFPYVELGDSDDLIIGEWAIALGNPYGLFDVNDQPSATAGIVSAVDMDFGRLEQSGRVYQDMIQTDAAINPGNSGGPLVDSSGRVIGINTFIFSGSGYSEGSIGIGFAIPINKAQKIVAELQKYGKIDRSFETGMQVQQLNERFVTYLQLPFTNGVIVVNVDRNSTADKAGVKVADVIASVNGTKVNSASDIQDVISNNDLRSGDKLQLRIYRDGNYRNIDLRLGRRNR